VTSTVRPDQNEEVAFTQTSLPAAHSAPGEGH